MLRAPERGPWNGLFLKELCGQKTQKAVTGITGTLESAIHFMCDEGHIAM
jgi:hypothetical protein